jgi:hypothetical protein
VILSCILIPRQVYRSAGMYHIISYPLTLKKNISASSTTWPPGAPHHLTTVVAFATSLFLLLYYIMSTKRHLLRFQGAYNTTMKLFIMQYPPVSPSPPPPFYLLIHKFLSFCHISHISEHSFFGCGCNSMAAMVFWRVYGTYHHKKKALFLCQHSIAQTSGSAACGQYLPCDCCPLCRLCLFVLRCSV